MAVTLSFDLTNAEATRLAAAVGRRDNLRDALGALRSATMAEAKQHFMRYAKMLVSETEAEADRETAPTRLAADINPT